MDNRTVSSNILSDSHYKWNEFKPDDDRFLQPKTLVPYAIRLVNQNKIAMESDTEIVYLEDIKIGFYDGVQWNVHGPFPRHDFSPLSNRSDLKEGTIVSHWAEVSKEAVHQWQHRLDPINKYEHLQLCVDEEHTSSVYSSLVMAGACLMWFINEGNPDEQLKQQILSSYAVICDLQATMDAGGLLTNAVDKQ